MSGHIERDERAPLLSERIDERAQSELPSSHP
jgi:hypothetical protein